MSAHEPERDPRTHATEAQLAYARAVWKVASIWQCEALLICATKFTVRAAPHIPRWISEVAERPWESIGFETQHDVAIAVAQLRLVLLKVPA